jgi:hypothetical protein
LFSLSYLSGKEPVKRKGKKLTVGNFEAKQGDEEECGDV